MNIKIENDFNFIENFLNPNCEVSTPRKLFNVYEKLKISYFFSDHSSQELVGLDTRVSVLKKSLTIHKLNILKSRCIDNEEYTLHEAIKKLDVEYVRLFLEIYDINSSDHENKTPWHFIAEHNSKSTIELSLEKRIENTEKIYAIIDLLFKKNVKLDIQDIEGNTPLLKALKIGNIGIAWIFLDIGFNPNIADNFGGTPLHVIAACYDNLTGMNLIEKLIISGANPNAINYKDGETPLHIAIAANHIEIAKCLLRNGADLDFPCKDFYTPYDYIGIYLGKKGSDFFPNAIIPFTTEKNDRKLLSGFWNIPGKTSIGSYSDIELEGNFGIISYFSIIDTMKEFVNDLKESNSFIFDIYSKTLNCFENCISNKYESDESLTRKYMEGDNLIFLSGYHGHLACILFLGNHMLVVNRGNFRLPQSVIAFPIKRKISETQMKMILRLKNKFPKEEWKNYIYSQLPTELKDTSSDISSDIISTTFHELIQKDQKTGNCYLTSLLTTILAIAIHEGLKEVNKSTNKLEKLINAKKMVPSIVKTYKDLKSFLKVSYLYKYMVRKINENDTNTLVYQPDVELIKNIYKRFNKKTKTSQYHDVNFFYDLFLEKFSPIEKEKEDREIFNLMNLSYDETVDSMEFM